VAVAVLTLQVVAVEECQKDGFLQVILLLLEQEVLEVIAMQLTHNLADKLYILIYMVAVAALVIFIAALLLADFLAAVAVAFIVAVLVMLLWLLLQDFQLTEILV
jgi:hypothetical protein